MFSLFGKKNAPVAPGKSMISGFDEIVDLAPGIIAEVDSNKVYTWLNKAGLDFFGEGAMGREASAYFVGEQATYELVEPLFRGRDDVYYVESWQRHRDGQKRLLAWWCRSIKDSSGKVVRVLSIARDITDQKLTEERLRHSEAQLSNALKIAKLGPWEYDFVKDVFTFTDLFYAMFRTTARDAGGYTMSSKEYAERFMFPDDVELVGKEIQKSVETDDPDYSADLEHRIRYADGEIGYISVRFNIVKDENGKTIRSYGVNQDITERKKSEQEMRKTKDELKSKLDDLEQFSKIAVNREVKMVELKERIAELEGELSARPPRT